ncbi:unnamed protein product [Allacma fusca]|uniref:b(0,+)-type amino acid transporter 1 n=1 Tax=Allacma fusca TaxID=39272 RepID=A0A8J2MAB8_9HEXA|nr:unnamed protein product [Allacma fusca]
MDNPGLTKDEDIKMSSADRFTTIPGKLSMDDGNKIEQDNLVNLKRTLGLFGSISLIVGSMMGSGIFVSPGGIFENTNSVWFGLIVWAVCGVLSICGGITYIELSTVVPSSGAEYSYILSAFGSVPGFLTAWASLVMIKPTSTATSCIAFAQYSMDPFVDDVKAIPWAVKLMTVAVILFLTFVNCYSAKLGAKVQIFFTVAKLVAIGVVVGSGIYNLIIGKTSYLKQDFDQIEWNMGKIAAAFFGGFYAYDGWNQLNFVTEEIKNPYKNLPRGIFIGLPLVGVCYLLANVSFLTVMTMQEVIDAPSVATIFGERMLGVMSFIMPLSVAMSAFGTANGGLFTSARVTYVAGREGHLPDVLGYVHMTRNTPASSLVVNCVCVVATALTMTLELQELIKFFGFTTWLIYGSTACAMIVMRYTKPNANRPFKAPLWMAGVVILMSGFLIIASLVLDPRMEYLYSAIFILCGLLFYIPFVHFQVKLPGSDILTTGIQKILMVVPPEGLWLLVAVVLSNAYTDKLTLDLTAEKPAQGLETIDVLEKVDIMFAFIPEVKKYAAQMSQRYGGNVSTHD